MSVISQINQTLVNAPLPLLIEKLGMAIANAQVALDRNSIDLANKMAKMTIPIEGKEYNLISLGFTPTFYAFTEATVEAKLSFSLAVSESFSIGASLSTNNSNSNSSNSTTNSGGNSSTEKDKKTGVMAVTVDASYSRKFDMSAEGSSSISARIVSLPPPERLKSLLQEISEKILVTSISIDTVSNNISLTATTSFQLTAIVLPADATDKSVKWSIVSGDGLISNSGILTLKPAAQAAGTIVVKAAARENEDISNTKTITIII